MTIIHHKNKTRQIIIVGTIHITSQNLIKKKIRGAFEIRDATSTIQKCHNLSSNIGANGLMLR